jgi:hypothetical protein
MAKNPEWLGRITGIALAVRGPLPEPARVDGVAIRSGGAVGQLGERFREWTAFEPWNGASINTITGGAEVQEVPLPTFLVIGVVLAAAIWLVSGLIARAWLKTREEAAEADSGGEQG